MNFITELAKIGILLCGVSFFTKCEARPVKRRAVSEMQLMHNYGEFRHSSQRHDWLQMKLHDIYPASVSTPQDSTPKVAESRPPKPHKKMNKLEENKIKHVSHRTNPKSHRHSAKPSTDKLKPDFQ